MELLAPQGFFRVVLCLALQCALGRSMRLRLLRGGRDDGAVQQQMRMDVEKALAPPDARRFLVFLCRPEDESAGWADRFAGLSGAAMLAMSTGRAFKIHWPGLSDVLQPGAAVNWTYDPKAMGISDMDESVLDRGKVEVQVSPSFPDPAFSGLSEDAAVFNSYMKGGKRWRGMTTEMSPAFEKFRVLYVAGNRGFTQAWFRDLASKLARQWPADAWLHLYRAIFDTLFVPTAAFMSTPVPLSSGEKLTLEQMVELLASGNAWSVAFHHRAGDKALEKEARGSCSDDRTTVPHEKVACLAEVAKKHLPRRVVVLAFSDSKCFASQVQRFLGSALGGEGSNATLWIPSKDGHVQIDTHMKKLPGYVAGAGHAFLQALRDFWLMRHTDALVFGHSGFPQSAGLVAKNTSQERIRACRACNTLSDEHAFCGESSWGAPMRFC